MAKKRFFFGTLAMVLALVFGLVLVGCSTDDDSSSGGGKVVAEKYRGEWHHATNPTAANGGKFILTENLRKDSVGTNWTAGEPAWTEGTKLIVNDQEAGNFTTDTTFVHVSGATFNKQ